LLNVEPGLERTKSMALIYTCEIETLHIQERGPEKAHTFLGGEVIGLSGIAVLGG